MPLVSENRSGLHGDADHALRAGFPDAIAPGLIPLSVPARLSGDPSLLLRRMEPEAPRPAHAGDRLTATLPLTAGDAEKPRMAAVGPVANQHGVAVMTGKPVGHLPDPAWGTPHKGN